MTILKKYNRVHHYWISFLLLCLSGCSSAGGQPPATATAQAERAIALATAMGRQMRATATFEAVQAQATAEARASLLGQASGWTLAFADSFDSDQDIWATGAEEDPELAKIEWRIAAGKYFWEAAAVSGFVWWVVPDDDPSGDFYATASVRQHGEGSVGEYGLVFRLVDNDEETRYYLFEVTESQQYGVFIYQSDTGWETLLDWTETAALQPGRSNRLAVIGQGSDFTLYINGQSVGFVTDSRLASGKVGLLVGLSNPDERAVWEFDDFEVRFPLTE